MINIHRGEVLACLDGGERRWRLSLGTLAELEHAFGVETLVDLLKLLSSGRLSARHLALIVAAGLRGAGEDVREEDVARMSTEHGAAGFAAIAKALVEASFGAGDHGGGVDAPASPDR